ncbi:hypothetical protein K503DRAFT_473840 [Rhizopogon vinicolor AM-OR11-026]|uniref:Uncharacterized protein n=1 Tax=Rhizopogon vinicolor AM-OR11-026 TaxID=1314800 RepID=A0A1B7MN95_9AGAM|nr:hypothetical protein K503DRAFT_473840 [Rhizopogon vinicolor AM-OR11-026]
MRCTYLRSCTSYSPSFPLWMLMVGCSISSSILVRLSNSFDFCINITELRLCCPEGTCRLLNVLHVGPRSSRAHCLSLELRAHCTT